MHVHISALPTLLIKHSVPVEMITEIMDDLIFHFKKEEERKLEVKFNNLRLEISQEIINCTK